jgi:hypothetical protein
MALTPVPESDEIVAPMDVLSKTLAVPRHLVADNGYDTAAQQVIPIGVVHVG